MKKTTLMKLLGLVLALTLALSTASVAFAWEPQWEHDEDLSDYKLCDNFGDVTIKVAVTDLAAIESWEENEFVKWIEEVTNVDLTFHLIPYENRAEQLGLLLASGDYPDMFLSCGMTSAMVSAYGVDEQLFLPLNDLIAEYGTYTKMVFENYPGTEALMTQLDGNIYSLPNVNECYHCTIPYKFWINQTWLDNLGLEMPTTLDELYNVLCAFRDQDANGNGDPTDEIPMAGDYQDGWYTNVDMPILNAFTYDCLDLDAGGNSDPTYFGMYVDDGTVTVPFYKDEFKQGVEYMAKLVSEGLIYTGSFTQDLAALTQICESGRLGCCAGGYILFANLGSDIYKQYRAVLPLAGPDGYQNVCSFPYDSVGGNTVVISADTEYPVECFKIADLLYSYAATMRGYYGVYGEHWTDAEEGQVGINGEKAMFKLLVPWQETEPQSYCVLQMTSSYRDAKFRLGEPSDPSVDLYSGEGLETLLYQVTHDYEPFADMSKPMPPLKFTQDENDEMSIIKVEVAASIQENMVAFYTGAKTVENDYDAFIADIEAKGIGRLVEIYQNAYDAQYK